MLLLMMLLSGRHSGVKFSDVSCFLWSETASQEWAGSNNPCCVKCKDGPSHRSVRVSGSTVASSMMRIQRRKSSVETETAFVPGCNETLIQ